MIVLAMATEVAASPTDVWRRLADPDEVAGWRPGVASPPRVEGAWPGPGAGLHLRARLRELPVELHDVVLESVPGRRLRCDVRLGLYRCEATWTLARSAAGTRLGLRVATPSETPLVGAVLDRFGVRRLAADLASTWLRALRDRCEGAPAAYRDGAAAAR